MNSNAGETARAVASSAVRQTDVSGSSKQQSAAALQDVAVVANVCSSLAFWSAAALGRFQWNSLAFANKPQPTLLDLEIFSCSVLPVFNQPFEIPQVFLHSVRETWWIENRANLERNFRFLLGTRLERDYARHETAGHGAPRDPPAGNLKYDVEDPFLVAAIRMPSVGKMCFINFAHLPKRGDELGKVLQLRPLLVDAINGRLHNDEMSGGVHCGWSCFHHLNQVIRR